MSKFNWRNGFGSGLFVGAILVLLVLLFFNPPMGAENPEIYEMENCENATKECSNDSEDVPDRWYWLRRAIAIEDSLAQWIMMGFTVIAAGLLLCTLKATQRMASDTRKLGIKQSLAATIANRIAKENAALQNRPWMTFSKVAMQPFVPAGYDEPTFVFNVDWLNTGNSPASRCAVYASIHTTREDQLTLMDKDFSTRDPEISFGQQSSTVPRNGLVSSFGIAISHAQKNDFLKGDLGIVAFSRVIYYDSFSGTNHMTDATMLISFHGHIEDADGTSHWNIKVMPIGKNTIS